MSARRQCGELKYDLFREAAAGLYATTHIAPKLVASHASHRSTFSAPVGRQPLLRWRTLPRSVESLDELLDRLAACEIRYVQGEHTIYIPPQLNRPAVFGDLDGYYPNAPGFKLLKRLAPPESAHYLRDTHNRWITGRLMGGVRQRTEGANLLYAMGLGPRLYDAVEVSSESMQLTCFVMEHVVGDVPSHHEHGAFVAKLTDLLTGDLRGAVALATPSKLRHRDFLPPDCNGNLIKRTVDGSLMYVDFQPFMLIDRGRIVEHLLNSVGLADGFAAHAAEARRRWASLVAVLKDQRIELHGRLVLDLACQLGFMLAGALESGARWAVGWADGSSFRTVERLQCLWGNTRVTVRPAPVEPSHVLFDDIPGELQGNLAEAVVLHAPTRHSGTDVHLPELGALPWKVLVHDMEPVGARPTQPDAAAAIERLYGCRLLVDRHVAQGSPAARRLAVFVRG